MGDSGPPDPPAILTIPKSQLELGSILTAGHLEIPLDVTNKSSGTVLVKGFHTSCDCAGIEPPTDPLGPGESERVVLRIDLTRSWGPYLSLGASEVPFEARVGVEFVADGETGQKTWFVRGRAKPYVRTEPAHVSFGRRSVLQPGFHPVRFKLTTQVPTTSVVGRVEGDGWDVRVRPTGRPDEYTGELRSTGPVPMGTHRVAARLKLARRDSTVLPDATLVIDGEVVPDVESYPSRLMFGGRVAGTTAEEQLLIESLSGRPIRLTRIDSPSPTLAASANFDATGPRHVVGVRWRQGAGTHEATLTVHYTVNGGSHESIQVVAQGTGFDP